MADPQGFQDGQTQTVGGVTYVRQDGVWHPQVMTAPQRLPSPQTPDQAQGQVLQNQHTAQEIQSQPLQNDNTRVNIAQGQASIQNQRFNQNQGLRQEYNNLPEVKNYSVALSSLGTALKSPDTPQGDLAVIYAYAKAADPGSVVREGEMDMATATASLPEQYRADAMRLTQGKRLPPEVRTGLIETMRQAVSGMRQTYDQQRSRYAALAQQSGFDPQQIVGAPLYDAIRPLEENYIRQHGGTPRDPNGVTAAQTEGRFRDQGGGPQQLTPEQQARDIAFVKTNPSPEQYAHFLAVLQGNPNGTVDLAQATAKLKALQSGAAYNPAIGMDPRSQALLDQMKQNGGAGDAAAVGAQQGVTLGAADEIAAAGAALKGSLSGQGSFGDLYNVNEQANQGYLDSLQQQHPIAFGAGELGGGAVLAPLTFGAQTPGQMAAVGGAMGAAQGFNSGEGGIGNRALGALEGGAAGSALGYAIPKASNMIFSRKSPPEIPPLVDPQTGALNQPLEAMTPGQRVVKAEEYGINLPADAAGGRTAAVIGKGLDIMPGSAGVMEDARRATESQVGAAADVVASNFGSSRTLNEAGAQLQSGANQFIDRSQNTIEKAYQAIPISPNAQTSTANTVAALQSLTSRFADNPDLQQQVGSKQLQGFLQAIQSKGLTWESMKALRSFVGEKIGERLFSDDASTGDLRAVYGALSEDMRDTAAAQGPRALQTFERANNLYSQRQQLIEGSLKRILGNDNNLRPEAAAAAVQAMTKGGKSTGDLRTLAQIKAATVKSGAWNEIAATLIRLGGQPANSAGRDFNPTTFVNWYADMAEPARDMLFGGKGADLRKALDGFVAVNQRLQKVNALRNTSNTGTGLVAAGTVGGLIVPTAAPKIIAVMAGNYGMAKLWTNPAFVRLITGYTKAVASGSDQAVKSQIGRISALAATNPDLREPLMALEQRLLNAANDNVGKAAASPQENQTSQQ